MFVPVKTTDGRLIPWEYFGAFEGKYEAGQMLTVKDGKLKKLSGNFKDVPSFLCMADVKAGEGQVIPSTKVCDRIIYETTLSEDCECLKIGDRLQVTNRGLEVGPGKGRFLVLDICGCRKGDVVRGKFRAKEETE